MNHLETLVRLGSTEDLNVEEPEAVTDCSDLIDSVLGCDDDDCEWVACCNGEDATAEILAVSQGRNDDSAVLVGVVGIARQRNWFEGPCCNAVDDQAKVTPKAAVLG